MADSEHGIDVAALINLINTRHAAAFTMHRRTGLGESGATYHVLDASNQRYILKFGYGKEFAHERAAEITARLAAVGYSAPRYVVVGEDGGLKYSIQTRMPGKPWQPVTRATLEQLLALNRLQDGLGNDPTEEPFPAWPARAVEGVLVGFQRYCVIDTLRRHSDATAVLLDTLQAMVVRHAPQIPAARDIVHWDFHKGNILSDGGEITGVVDWEGVCTGDRGFDLATYLFYAFEDSEAWDFMWHEAIACSGHAALAVYLAHMIVRQTDWTIRHHDPKLVEREMARADAILRALASG